VVATSRTSDSGLTDVVGRLVAQAASEVQLLGALAPVDAHRERARLVDALRDDRPLAPRWTYARWARDDLRRALDAAERALDGTVGSDLDALYLERVRELSLEAAMCAAAGTPEVGRLSPRRFAPLRPAEARDASACCAAWLAEPKTPAPTDTLASDADDPGSLLSLLRAAVGRHKLPFTVMVQPALASLAATGDGVLLVAPGRPITPEDAARTVLHEIEGHALPRTRARTSTLPLLRAGTARGVDDQEGLALLLEERAGLLGPRRRGQLAARHRAFEAMTSGATFGEVARMLERDHGLDVLQAVVTSERVFRGGDGTCPGLGRERVYLESLGRVRAHLAAQPGDEDVLSAGQIAVRAAPALRPFTAALTAPGSTRTATSPCRRSP
jgi:hypothetical protein